MSTELENSLEVTENGSEYDNAAKRILAHKEVLARILIAIVDEFCDMKPEEVISCIEGEPLVGKVPVAPGLTNEKKGDRVIGMNTENTEINEGLIRFDIIFYVRLRDGVSQFIINIEAQRQEPTDYPILNRGIFYASRMLSSQKGRDFEKSNYGDIKRVYSIWICMNLEQSCTTIIQFDKKDILGNHLWDGDLKLLNVALIGLPKELPSQDANYSLHRFLTGLLSNRFSFEYKRQLLSEYQIQLDEDFSREVKTMCNLSLSIMEEGLAKGRVEGRTEGRAEGRTQEKKENAIALYEIGIPIEQIVLGVRSTKEQVMEWIREAGLA